MVPAAHRRHRRRRPSGSTPGACSRRRGGAAPAGLVSRVVAPDALLPTARALAREIADNTSAVSVALSRQMLWKLLGADHPMEAHRLDSQGMFWTGRVADAHEGVTSFLEKRPPRFTLTPERRHAALLSVVGAPHMSEMAPLAAYLPFNRDCITSRLRARQARRDPRRAGRPLGHPAGLEPVVSTDGHELSLPAGARPAGFDNAHGADLSRHLPAIGVHWVLSVPEGGAAAAGVPCGDGRPDARGTKLPDDLLTLGGMASQPLWWESTSAFCPRCGKPTTRIAGEWGKKCSGCGYEHYPHLHPCRSRPRARQAGACCSRARRSGRRAATRWWPASWTTASRSRDACAAR